jgi:hypothetical protein
MGHRVTTWFETREERPTAQVYLHWNGSLASVAAYMVLATELGGHPALPSAFTARFIAAATLAAATRDYLTVYVQEAPRSQIKTPTKQEDNGRMQWIWTRPDLSPETTMVRTPSGTLLHPSHQLAGFELTWDHKGHVERLSWAEVLTRVNKDPYWAPERHILPTIRQLFHPDALYPPLPELTFSHPAVA